MANETDTLQTGRRQRRHAPGHAPLLLPACCLAAGIAVGTRLWPLLPPAPVLPALLGVLVAAALCCGRWPLVQSVGVWLCFLLLGLLVAPAHKQEGVAYGTWTEAVVASPPGDRPKTLMADLLLAPKGERQRCYIWKDERSRQLRPGDNLLVCIRDGQFISRDGWRRGGDGFNRLPALQRLRIKALTWRERALRRIATPHADADAQAVVAAMALGDRRALSSELRDTYSVSGASHILALSGLHLSIIYLLLTSLTLGRRRFWLGQVVTVLALWAFALLTGLSTSVVRAATMLTVYALFALGGRRHAPLGVLSFTAIVMLLADSSALFDVGFQLSFMAMLAILLFMPCLQAAVPQRWMTGNPPVRWLGSLAGVSVAAQLGTAPLVAFYFGRFSPWFLLTNAVAVPLATLILYGAAAAMLIPAAAGLLLSVVAVLNGFLAFVGRLPLASIEGLHPSALQVAMAYAAISAACAAVFIVSRSATRQKS